MKLDCYFADQLTGSHEITDTLCRIPVKGLKKEGMRKFQMLLPILDFQGFWTPEERLPSNKIQWNIQALSAPQRSFPYLTFFNAAQQNRASFALDNFTSDIKIIARMNQEKCLYEITILVAEREDTPDYVLTLDFRKDLSWGHALRDWFKGLNLPPRHFPDQAWDPVFCTWYAVHGEVTQDWVEDTVREALPLGFKTLIIDDGWSYDTMKRVCPATTGTWYDSIGNWTISKAKFPDFAAHVKRVQAMGMNYMLWTAPFLIGDKSEIYEEFKDSVLPDWHEGGCFTFDSAYKDKGEILIGKLTDLLKKYGLDGLKIDFLDYIRPNMERPRGPETIAFIRDLSRRLREISPEVLMEYRQAYATPQMLAYGTQFRAGDVPFDYRDNFARLAQIRISLGGGDGIPVHADPVYWHPDETPANISRHMIASLGGVPMLSMELKDMKEETRQIIRFWLKFYREHQVLLNHGHWEVSYHPLGVDYMQAAGENETVIILSDESRLNQALKAAGGRKLHLLNLTPAELSVEDKMETFNCFGAPAAPGIIPMGGYAMRAEA